jgi:hypothetical protein
MYNIFEHQLKLKKKQGKDWLINDIPNKGGIVKKIKDKKPEDDQ